MQPYDDKPPLPRIVSQREGPSDDGAAAGSRRHGAPLRCKVDNCNADLDSAPKTHQRFRLCNTHIKAPCILVDGISQRFCQQCSRFHPLSEFEGTNRTCRVMLAKNRARQRSHARRQPPLSLSLQYPPAMQLGSYPSFDDADRSRLGGPSGLLTPQPGRASPFQGYTAAGMSGSPGIGLGGPAAAVGFQSGFRESAARPAGPYDSHPVEPALTFDLSAGAYVLRSSLSYPAPGYAGGYPPVVLPFRGPCWSNEAVLLEEPSRGAGVDDDGGWARSGLREQRRGAGRRERDGSSSDGDSELSSSGSSDELQQRASATGAAGTACHVGAIVSASAAASAGEGAGGSSVVATVAASVRLHPPLDLATRREENSPAGVSLAKGDVAGPQMASCPRGVGASPGAPAAEGGASSGAVEPGAADKRTSAGGAEQEGADVELMHGAAAGRVGEPGGRDAGSPTARLGSEGARRPLPVLGRWPQHGDPLAACQARTAEWPAEAVLYGVPLGESPFVQSSEAGLVFSADPPGLGAKGLTRSRSSVAGVGGGSGAAGVDGGGRGENVAPEAALQPRHTPAAVILEFPGDGGGDGGDGGLPIPAEPLHAYGGSKRQRSHGRRRSRQQLPEAGKGASTAPTPRHGFTLDLNLQSLPLLPPLQYPQQHLEWQLQPQQQQQLRLQMHQQQLYLDQQRQQQWREHMQQHAQYRPWQLIQPQRQQMQQQQVQALGASAAPHPQRIEMDWERIFASGNGRSGGGGMGALAGPLHVPVDHTVAFIQGGGPLIPAGAGFGPGIGAGPATAGTPHGVGQGGGSRGFDPQGLQRASNQDIIAPMDVFEQVDAGVGMDLETLLMTEGRPEAAASGDGNGGGGGTTCTPAVKTTAAAGAAPSGGSVGTATTTATATAVASTSTAPSVVAGTFSTAAVAAATMAAAAATRLETVGSNSGAPRGAEADDELAALAAEWSQEFLADFGGGGSSAGGGGGDGSAGGQPLLPISSPLPQLPPPLQPSLLGAALAPPLFNRVSDESSLIAASPLGTAVGAATAAANTGAGAGMGMGIPPAFRSSLVWVPGQLAGFPQQRYLSASARAPRGSYGTGEVMSRPSAASGVSPLLGSAETAPGPSLVGSLMGRDTREPSLAGLAAGANEGLSSGATEQRSASMAPAAIALQLDPQPWMTPPAWMEPQLMLQQQQPPQKRTQRCQLRLQPQQQYGQPHKPQHEGQQEGRRQQRRQLQQQQQQQRQQQQQKTAITPKGLRPDEAGAQLDAIRQSTDSTGLQAHGSQGNFAAPFPALRTSVTAAEAICSAGIGAKGYMAPVGAWAARTAGDGGAAARRIELAAVVAAAPAVVALSPALPRVGSFLTAPRPTGLQGFSSSTETSGERRSTTHTNTNTNTNPQTVSRVSSDNSSLGSGWAAAAAAAAVVGACGTAPDALDAAAWALQQQLLIQVAEAQQHQPQAPDVDAGAPPVLPQLALLSGPLANSPAAGLLAATGGAAAAAATTATAAAPALASAVAAEEALATATTTNAAAMEYAPEQYPSRSASEQLAPFPLDEEMQDAQGVQGLRKTGER